MTLTHQLNPISLLARTAALLVSTIPCACRANAPTASGAPATGGAAEKLGVLAPAGGTTLSIWPEAYAGEWLVLEVVPHGATVAEGDVLVRVQTRAIDEELHRAELDHATSALNHRATLERNQLEVQGAEANLARSRAGLERAKRALESWKTDELAFEQRQDELNRRYQDANLEDQTDELDQLEKMYQGDELVDATEDIVLKRSRRSLSISEVQTALSRDRARVRRELELVLEGERREEEFRAQQEGVERLERQQAIDAGLRADAEKRSADSLAEQQEKLARLQRDRALFELRAPCAGVLLHGAARDFRPGKSPARHERGGQLAPRTDLFVVAPAEPTGVAFDVTDAERARFASGASLTVRPLAGEGHAAARVALDEYPRALGTGETTLEGSAVLEQPLPGSRYGERVRIEVGGVK